MNNKSFSLFLLTAVLLISSVSALNFDVSSPGTLSKAVNSTSFTIRNNEAFTLNVSVSVPLSLSDGTNSIAINPISTPTFQLTAGNTSTITLTRSQSIPSAFKLGIFPDPSNIVVSVVNADNSSATDNRTSLLQFRNSFCEEGKIAAGLEITRITDETLDNEDEWEWNPLDNIELTVKVKNDNGTDLDTIVEWGLYDVTNNEFVDLDETSVDLAVDDGDSEEATINFQVPADVNDATYRFYVKVYEDGNEDEICSDSIGDDYFRSVDIVKETRQVILSDIESPESAACNDAATVKATVYNTGEKDEKRVKIRIFNRELNVDQFKEITSFDSGEDDDISFSLVIPENATEKTYTFTLSTQYDYDSGDSSYNEKADDKTVSIKVEGNCVKPVTRDATISATLDSSAVAGQNIIVKATIKNTGQDSTTYTIMTTGTDSIGTVESVNPQTVTLDAGQSKDVLITIKANADSEGDHTFNIKTLFNGQTKEQAVSLTVEPSKSVFGNIPGLDSLKGNWFIIIIVLINVVLIVLIIVVATRIAKS